MKIGRGLMVTKKLLWSLKHDRRSLVLILFAPVMAMFVFGIAFSGEVDDVKVVVLDQDEGLFIPQLNLTVIISHEVLSNIEKGKLSITIVESYNEGVEDVESGRYRSFVHFPENFTRSLLLPILEPGATVENGTLSIRSDQSNVNVASEVQKAFANALLKTIEDRGYTSPLSVDTSSPIYGKGAEFIDMFVPGIMGFVVFLLTTLLTLITFVGERTNGTLDRLLASSVTEGEIVLGYAVAFSMIGMVQVAILLSLAMLVFDIIVVGNPLIAFLIASLLAVVSVSLGILLSSLAQREAQAIQFFPFLVLPAFLLSGVFWPLEAIPEWLRPVSYIVPVTYAVEGLRSVLLRGWGLTDIWFDILILVLFALVFLSGAVISLKMRKK
ncbi:MAG: ABC transporter permease [Candidatus Thermoplasmatota archaeon]|nr:ABC transporter permease [Candidatus Thermoplasmatota archaeon]